MATKEKNKNTYGRQSGRDDDFGVYLANKHKEKSAAQPKKAVKGGKKK